MKLQIEFYPEGDKEAPPRHIATLTPGSLKNIIDHSFIPARTVSVFYPHATAAFPVCRILFSYHDAEGRTQIDLNNQNSIVACLPPGYGYEQDAILSRTPPGMFSDPTMLEQGCIAVRPVYEPEDGQIAELN